MAPQYSPRNHSICLHSFSWSSLRMYNGLIFHPLFVLFHISVVRNSIVWYYLIVKYTKISTPKFLQTPLLRTLTLYLYFWLNCKSVLTSCCHERIYKEGKILVKYYMIRTPCIHKQFFHYPRHFWRLKFPNYVSNQIQIRNRRVLMYIPTTNFPTFLFSNLFF